MKRFKKYTLIIPSCILLAGGIAACKKSFLDKAPLGTLNQQILANEAGVQGLLIGTYSLVDGEGSSGDGIGSAASNWLFGGIAADDAYKGSDPSDGGADWLPIETHAVTSTNPSCSQKFKLCYGAIQRANDVLRTMALATDIKPEEATTIRAETRFLRGFFHFELKRIFNMVPYVDETVVTTNANVDLSNTTDIYPKIEADFQAAVDSLPETQPQVGRVNKSAAKAFLAKVYMYEHKYAEAKAIFDDIIPHGQTSDGKPYDLLPNYFSNFNPAQKNSQESVFAAQTSVNDNSSTAWSGEPNGNFGDILNFPYNGGPGGCCGFYNPSNDLGDAYKTDAAGLPLLDTWYTGEQTDKLVPYSGSVDPRIDFTIGRPGIPYLDWGVHPGDDWIRNPSADGHFSPKKNVYAQAQKGTYSDVSAYWAPTELTANNVNLMRFSDVLLMAAEAEIEVGSTAKALEYVNRVRSRVKDHQSTWVQKTGTFNPATYTYSGDTTSANFAGNYHIGLYTAAQFADKDFATKAVRFERRLELAMEGHRFFDLKRWDNGTGTMADILNAYAKRETPYETYSADKVFVKGKSENFPIPQDQIDLANNQGKEVLKQNPGY